MNGRPRSQSAPAELAKAAVRPTTLYFYCNEKDYDSILLHKAIWISGGVKPDKAEKGSKGTFPVGPYATSVPPDTLAQNKEAFRKQFYGDYKVELTHFVAFRIRQGWAPRGVNPTGPDDPAQWAWHWVGENEPNDWIVRRPFDPGDPLGRKGDIRDAVSVTIVAHGKIPDPISQ